jgi:hypothetical protein
MAALEEKPLPVTASVKAGPPAVAELGFNVVIAGAGLIVNCAPLDVTPPELTVTFTVPALAIKAAETGAVNWLGLWTVVGRADPFHWTTAPARKPLPFTVSVKAEPLAVAEFGLREVMAGGALIENATPFEVTPDRTVIVALP